MSITLNHTIVPAHDKVTSAKFFADLFGLAYDGPMGPFASVRINDTLTLDFADRQERFDGHHYAFHVGDAEFDAIFERIKAAGLKYGSMPGRRRTCRSAISMTAAPYSFAIPTAI